MTMPEKIMRAVANVVARQGAIPFSRLDVLRETDVDSHERQRTFDPTFQGMRIDQHGGAPNVGERYKNVFRQVSYGQYQLTPYGEELLHQFQH